MPDYAKVIDNYMTYAQSAIDEFSDPKKLPQIAISVDMGDPESLAEMVHQANNDVVALGDRLSNNVYHYDKDLRKLQLVELDILKEFKEGLLGQFVLDNINDVKF